MRVKSHLISLVCFVLLLSMPAFGQSNLSVEELKAQYKMYNDIANNPDIFWFIGFDDVPGKFVSRERFEKMMTEKIMLMGNITLEQKVAAMTHNINVSQKVKADLRIRVLPELEVLIKERENSSNPHINLNNNTNHQTSDASSSGSSFNDLVGGMASEEHLNPMSYESFVASSKGTDIKDSQRESYDGNWNNASNDNYSSCPKMKPDNRSSFRAYPNGQTSGNTYRNCAYFGNGYLQLEEAYVNGKREGLVTNYAWSNEHNFSYANQRTNYSNGKRNGIQDIYSVSKSGAVYRMRFTTYSDGIQHGDSAQWYDNGQTSKETNFFAGKPTLQYNYNRDGSLSYCTKWGSDHKPRNCKTGEIRRY
ncbi:MAG: hypothetical protein KKC46_11615 [Proteobacteria bacterium]|nr:hypothetical protein [Pseudomonadota bacterium]